MSDPVDQLGLSPGQLHADVEQTLAQIADGSLTGATARERLGDIENKLLGYGTHNATFVMAGSQLDADLKAIVVARRALPRDNATTVGSTPNAGSSADAPYVEVHVDVSGAASPSVPQEPTGGTESPAISPPPWFDEPAGEVGGSAPSPEPPTGSAGDGDRFPGASDLGDFAPPAERPADVTPAPDAADGPTFAVPAADPRVPLDDAVTVTVPPTPTEVAEPSPALDHADEPPLPDLTLGRPAAPDPPLGFEVAPEDPMLARNSFTGETAHLDPSTNTWAIDQETEPEPESVHVEVHIPVTTEPEPEPVHVEVHADFPVTSSADVPPAAPDPPPGFVVDKWSPSVAVNSSGTVLHLIAGGAMGHCPDAQPRADRDTQGTRSVHPRG